ncbi:hypothetical protein KQY27_08860 [Methanobrevibacter sp. TMH8]|uniref:hypothetical protein n=1 Tax=Methanobrevibacter sp. TMH8 TaxID=2848611 RepID=UPI001CCF3A74|nr:hypothetical protein [Methanobrevibacter sp. TMH8]MBZ9571654.1 hypothetical protein [Methanobrevibacter sp. TMH8]
MYKIEYAKPIIFLILLVSVFFVLISASSAAMYDPTKTIDHGKKIIKVNNTKYKLYWETEQSIYQDKKKMHISYKSMKNKADKGYLYIEFYKTGKKKMGISKQYSSMIYGTEKIVKLKTNTDDFYWKKLRPKISNIIKKPILNKGFIKYNETRYINATYTDPKTGNNVTKPYKINWVVFYYTQTSSIEIMAIYTNLSALNNSNILINRLLPSDQIIRLDKFAKGKLKITSSVHDIMPCGPTKKFRYVNTNLTPKQYYLKVLKKEFETKI